MAATIVIGSCVLAADGKTLTATLSGGSGSGYTPSSAVTKLVVKTGTPTYYIASTSIAGTTLTITLDTFVPSGATVTVDLASTSNLSDSGSNTAQGQTGVACTNNSTQTQTTFASSDANVYFLANTSTGTWLTRPFINLQDATHGNRFETNIVGTDASVLVIGGFADFTVKVDGGAATTYTTASFSGTVWTWIKLFSGLSDTAHNVRVTGLHFDTATTIAVKGAAPATAKPTGYGTFLPVASAPFLTYSAVDGLYTNLTVLGNASTTRWLYGEGAIRFTAAITDLWIFAPQSSLSFALLRDGVQVAYLTPGGSLTWDLLQVATGLSSAQANYELVACGDISSCALYAVMLTGGTGLVSQTQAAPKDLWAFYGDSITATLNGLTSTPKDSRDANSYILARAVGATPIRRGAGGRLTHTAGRDNTAEVTGLTTPVPKCVFVQLGTNDLGQTPQTLANFQASYQTMLSNIRTGLPSAKIYAVGIFPTTRDPGTYGSRLDYNAIIKAVVVTLADANIFYVDTDGTFDPSDLTQSAPDGVHPNARGYSQIAAKEYLNLFPVGGFGSRL